MDEKGHVFVVPCFSVCVCVCVCVLVVAWSDTKRTIKSREFASPVRSLSSGYY